MSRQGCMQGGGREQREGRGTRRQGSRLRPAPLTTSCQPACCRAIATCQSTEPSNMGCEDRAAVQVEGAAQGVGNGNATQAAARRGWVVGARAAPAVRVVLVGRRAGQTSEQGTQAAAEQGQRRAPQPGGHRRTGALHRRRITWRGGCRGSRLTEERGRSANRCRSQSTGALAVACCRGAGEDRGRQEGSDVLDRSHLGRRAGGQRGRRSGRCGGGLVLCI